MQERVYECKKCGEKGTTDSGFYVKFIGKKTTTRQIRHSECNGVGKWVKGERIYNHEKSDFLDEIQELHGVYMGSYVTVHNLEAEGMLKVIGIKRGSRRKIRVDVWNTDSKFCWNVPVKSIKKVWNASDA